MKKHRIAFLFSLALVMALAVSGTALAAGNPVVKDDWKSGDAAFECAQIGSYDAGYKVDAAAPNGSWTSDFNTITISDSNGKVFDWSSTAGIGAVIVKAATGANVWFYDPQATSDVDLFGYQDKDISHVTFCWNYALTAAKTADAEWTKTISWNIVKESDGSYSGSAGDSFTHGYKVSVDKTETFGPYVVEGTVTVNNPTPKTVGFEVNDLVAGVPATVNCPTYELAPGESATCTYSAELDGAVNGTNTAAIASLNPEVDGATTSDGYEFGDPIIVGVEAINVSDTNGQSWQAAGSASWEYTKDFSCPVDASVYTNGEYKLEDVNTATIVETGAYDQATVTLTCIAAQQCYADETAWAAGPRYAKKGNWATYTPYVAGSTVTLYAGQTMEAGTVHFSAAADGKVTITITLNDGWKFADAGENVKIQDYASAPSGNPAPGRFAWKGTATSSSFSIDVPENKFYGVHADLLHSVECPVAASASLAYGSGSLFLPVVQK